jgi:hypothetical protein
MATFAAQDLSADHTGTSQIAFSKDQTTIIGLLLANTATETVTVDVQVRGVYLIKGARIPIGSTLSILDGKLIVDNLDTITVTTSAAGETVDMICSYLEVL